MTDVDKAGEEDDGQWRTVILDELSDVSVEQVAVANDTTEVCDSQDEQRHHHCQVRRAGSRHVPLSREDLNALLEINEGDIKAEDVTGETSDIGEAIASICGREDPMHNQGPNADPAHEGEKVGAGRNNNVVDGVTEDGNWSYAGSASLSYGIAFSSGSSHQ